MLGRALREPDFHAVVIADSPGHGWARRAGPEAAIPIELKRRSQVKQECLPEGLQEARIAVNRSVHTFPRIHNGIDFPIGWIGQGRILNDVVEAATIIARFERPVPGNLVVESSNVLVLAIRLDARG